MVDDKKIVPIGIMKYPSQILRSFVNDEKLEDIEEILIITRDKEGRLQASHNSMSLERMVYMATALYKYATE
jgi:hypothetical protein